MSTSTWTGADSSDWDDADNWSPAGVPGPSSDVTIPTGAPVAVVSASIGTVNSITDSSDLSFESAGTNTVTTFLDDAGHLWVDHNPGEGGTTLDIGETLTNSNHLVIGNTTLSATDDVTAASVDNTGRIYLIGSAAEQALLDMSDSAGFGTAGVLSGYVRLAGDSAIEFQRGQITSLAAGAHLGLVGNDAFIEDGTAPGKNSALNGLASIGRGAVLALHDGASVSTTGGLANNGYIYLDTNSADSGGSTLTVGGTLTNSHDLIIINNALSAPDEVTAAALDNTGLINLGGSSADPVLVDVTGSAGFGTAGALSGDVILQNSAIEFAGGQISTIATGAQLTLAEDGYIEDSTTLGSNSALTGLANVSGGLYLANGASVSTKGALTNNGVVSIGDGGSGESSLTVGGHADQQRHSHPGVDNCSVTEQGLDDCAQQYGLDLSPRRLRDQRFGSDDQQQRHDDHRRHRGTRRSGRRRGVLQPRRRQSPVRLERLGRTDHRRVRRGQAHARAGAVLRRHDLRFRDPRHDRRDELCRDRNDVQFRREFGHDGRHAHADRHESESDRQHPDDRRLFQLEFHSRPRQRDRHSGEIRLSRCRAAILAGVVRQSG
jgi:hypothetical protein